MKSLKDKVIVQNIKMLCSYGINCERMKCASCILHTKQKYNFMWGTSQCVYTIISYQYNIKIERHGQLQPKEFLEKLNQIFSEGCDECDHRHGKDCKLYINNQCFPWFLRHKDY